LVELGCGTLMVVSHLDPVPTFGAGLDTRLLYILLYVLDTTAYTYTTTTRFEHGGLNNCVQYCYTGHKLY